VMISCGSTGAVLAAAILIVGRIKGVKRPAIASLLPAENGPVMLLDSGANTNLDENNLLQFAIMGNTYMRLCQGIENPRVSLISNGEEDEKGNELTKKTNALLKLSDLNFVGNIEGRDILSGKADVVVCDGFTGNVIIKTLEGMALFIKKSLKDMFGKNIIKKMFAVVYLNDIKIFKKKMDYREYGGSPLLGIKKPIIKCHGASDYKAIYKSIEKAMNIINTDFEEEIERIIK
ncbi:MAG: phosphate acyltransferase PlsX, partial [Clostridia bacterium]|nr:phosphate acyltransferase PlsX [Clostridia bacterium]